MGCLDSCPSRAQVPDPIVSGFRLLATGLTAAPPSPPRAPPPSPHGVRALAALAGGLQAGPQTLSSPVPRLQYTWSSNGGVCRQKTCENKETKLN